MIITPDVITSPPNPKNVDRTEHVVVDAGKILRLEFTRFDVGHIVTVNIETCLTDFVRITDGDGTTLMDNSCGYSDRDPSDSHYFQPPFITTKTNKVEIYFHTNDGARPGWSLRWTAVAEGECYHRVIVLLPTFLSVKKTLFICCWQSCDIEQLKCSIAYSRITLFIFVCNN